MADGANTAAMKQRIITHMNADHQDSLSIFLEHYCQVPSYLASDAQLEDVGLSHLIIRSKAGRNMIPLEPPMESYAHARERMVEMHHAAYKGLDRSEITVTEYRLPKTLPEYAALTLALSLVCALSSRRNFQDGSLLHGALLKSFPGFERLCYRLQPLGFTVLLLAHSMEVFLLARTKLRRHGVPLGSSLWWKWVLPCFVDGFASFQRFGLVVKEAEEKKGFHKPTK